MSSKMSFTKSTNEALKALQRVVHDVGGSVNAKIVHGTYSQESAVHFVQGVEAETHMLRSGIVDALQTLDPTEFSAEAVGEMSESMKAGVIAALASQKPGEYNRRALAASPANAISMESLAVGAAGNIEYTDVSQLSMESFDETELRNFAAQNIIFNVLASRQDEFGEGFFPTKVVAPSEGGISMTVDKQEVINYATHDTTGALLNVARTNLIKAFQDSTVLSKQTTELVPYARADNSSNAYFVAAADVATKNLEVAGVTVPTRPLLLNTRMNLLGLSQHPGLIENGILDMTDQIGGGIRLKTLYMKLVNDVADPDPDVVEVISFNVANMNRIAFKKSAEGRGREMTLNFITKSLVIDKTVKTIAGAPSALLDTAVIGADVVVVLSVSVSGHVHLDTGELMVTSSTITVEEVRDNAGNSLSLAAGAGKVVVDAMADLSAQMIGFDLAARRTNTNWRSTGTVIDVTPIQETYAIEPGYPISVVSPTDETQNGAKINGMINAVRVRNANNAVTALLNYAEQLSAVKLAMELGVEVDVVGIGRHIVTPYYDFSEVDVADAIINMKSMERGQDVAYVIVAAIRDMAYRMYASSNYCSALALANAGTAVKPKLIIGVDNVTKRYLDLTGDNRLLGSEMDYKIVATNDDRMANKIFLTFTTDRPGSDDGLSFGVHAFIPELIQRVNTSRNGATVKNDRVVPRNTHIPVLPVLGEIALTNLAAAANNVI